MNHTQHTIAALSTPTGESGIAVVRMSGPESLEILSRLYRTRGGKPFDDEWEHRRLYPGRVTDAEGEPVDDVICAVMRAPDTYTGEDVVEISCHGGMVIVSRLLDLLFGAGARSAEAGEFTKRAFLNGKMDLIQAEAVADLIHARSELQRKVAHRQLAGALSEQIEALADGILELLGIIEANIDFIEEGIDTLDVDGSLRLLDGQANALDTLLESAPLSRPFRDGYSVAVAGPVNAGKSSLFNRIVGEQRAIVTDIPGTTRDLLREPIILEGLLFVIQDTAGLREATGDRVESIGIGLATDAARSADVVIFVIDGTGAIDEATTAAIRDLDPARSVLVVNKRDLPAAFTDDYIKSIHPELGCVRLSALNGEGVAGLVEAMCRRVGSEALTRMARERVVLNARLLALLREARSRTDILRESLRERKPLEMLAVEAREVLTQYEEAVGRKYQDNLLDIIFSRFCIGK